MMQRRCRLKRPGRKWHASVQRNVSGAFKRWSMALLGRLREDGGTLAEWQRLIRAWRVLGQEKNAEEAYRDALNAFKDKPQESKALKAFATQMGIAAQASER